MVEIIPSINVRTFEEVKERVRLVEPHVRWCHLDVTDGIFSKHLTWHNPADLPLLDTKLSVEAHLMVSDPEKIIDQWLVKPVKRLIFHIEAMKDPELIIKKCRDAGVEIGFAINPETFWGKFKPWLRPVRSKTPEASADSPKANRTSNGVKKIDIFQILAVHPGPSGQDVDWPEMLDKIIHIRKSCPECIIEVDGGINPETAKKTVAAEANLLVVGAYLFRYSNIKISIDEILRGSTS